MATHSSILDLKTPWTEEPGVLHSPWGLKDTKECPSAAQPPAECLQMASGCLGQRLIQE